MNNLTTPPSNLIDLSKKLENGNYECEISKFRLEQQGEWN